MPGPAQSRDPDNDERSDFGLELNLGAIPAAIHTLDDGPGPDEPVSWFAPGLKYRNSLTELGIIGVFRCATGNYLIPKTIGFGHLSYLGPVIMQWIETATNVLDMAHVQYI